MLSFFLPTPPKIQATDASSNTKLEEDTSIYKNTISLKPALFKYETWVIFAMFACAGMAGHMMTSQMTNIASVQIPGWGGAYILVMALAGSSGAGRLIISTLSDKLGVFNTWKLIFATQIVNMMFFRNYTSPNSIIWGTIVMGLFYGASIPLCWASVAAVYGKKYLGSIYGIVTNGFAVAALVGPLLAARIVDTTNSYNGTFIAIAGFGILGMILAFTIKENKK